ncbi:MAG TPA: biopolymer transporter ExbD, partial [Steroidobacteraceae bacterium]|nr:biopolymer transporter ExbD [Steroidobacteraceae bacterium]
MKMKPRRSEEPEINVVSLIDVVLLLVVFFMLSSNFTAEGRLQIRLPQANSGPTSRNSDEGLVVTV